MLTNGAIIFRLFLSVILSGLVGMERQMHKRTAGLRTHILVSLGSCLIMLTSMYVFDIYIDRVALDPARIAAGVITGIGFLGGGAILHDKNEVRGLTTAASLWVAAGLGLAVGCGFYLAAICTTGLTIIVLLALRRLEQKVFDNNKSQEGDGYGL